MGCGSSNTLETSEFRKFEQTQKTQFMKILENFKPISSKITDIIIPYYSNSSNRDEKSIEKLAKNYLEENTDCKLTLEEVQNCITYAIVKNYLIRVYKEKNEGLISEFFKNADTEKINLADKIIKQNAGESFEAAVTELEFFSFLAKFAFRTINYDPEFANINSLVFIFKEVELDCLDSIKELASVLKSHLAKNVVIITIDEEAAKDLSNLSIIFEGISLSKNLKNLNVVRITKKNLSYKPESVDKIVTSINQTKLLSLCLINLAFSEKDRLKLCEAIAKNDSLTLVGLQELDDNDKTVGIISNIMSKSKSLRCLMLGSKSNNFDEEVRKKNQELFKGNSKFECLVLGTFKDN